MHPDWSAFLQSQAAAAAPGPDPEPTCALIDLVDLGLIAVRGPDAVAFLQGQVTNDLRELSATHTQLSSHCSPKGRILASFRVIQADDGLWLSLPRVQIPALLKRLRMFLLRSQATLTDISDELICLGVIGEPAAPVLRAQFGELPELDGALVRADAGALIRIPGTPPRWQVIAPVGAARDLWLALAPMAGEADQGRWTLADIRAGLPTVLPETVEAFVPQMLNLQLIDGVSFHKGCYCGQEVVARMQYLGKLKRRMYHASVASDTVPAPGTLLFAPGSTSEQGPGQVVIAGRAGPGQVELLAVVELAAAAGGELRLGEQGPVLTLQAPPYGLPEAV